MARLAILREAQRPQLTQQAGQIRRASVKHPTSTPSCHNERSLGRDGPKMKVVVRSQRIRGRPHLARGCSAERKRIRHDQPAIAPPLGKADAPSNGRIIVPLVCGRRIEPHECDGGRQRIPDPTKLIAPRSIRIRRKDRRADQPIATVRVKESRTPNGRDPHGAQHTPPPEPSRSPAHSGQLERRRDRGGRGPAGSIGQPPENAPQHAFRGHDRDRQVEGRSAPRPEPASAASRPGPGAPTRPERAASRRRVIRAADAPRPDRPERRSSSGARWPERRSHDAWPGFALGCLNLFLIQRSVEWTC